MNTTLRKYLVTYRGELINAYKDTRSAEQYIRNCDLPSEYEIVETETRPLVFPEMSEPIHCRVNGCKRNSTTPIRDGWSYLGWESLGVSDGYYC
jgi:hypothetical protein